MPSPKLKLTQHRRYGLEGRVVTMDAGLSVLPEGVVYIHGDRIVDVRPSSAPPPQGFSRSSILRTGDTIYPGLIELHNHLSYNALTLWDVPKRYSNNSQWRRHPDYRRLISGPMQVVGKTAGLVEAVVRYVECKCLIGGVTTSQGIMLYSNAGIRKFYRGLVRNVEETERPELPEARTKISNVDAAKADRFLAQLRRSSCLLLHLSEGLDDRARGHFEALELENGTWAITPALSGIHSAALKAVDFRVMDHHGASMVWSPMSNYLLYGGTADVKAAKEAGILIGIGSDWSPSGSKNLIGELKVAHLVSQEQGGLFAPREIVAMATTNAAKILKWDAMLGSVEAGKLADLMIVNGRTGDPYLHLLESRETSVTFVVINGVPRYGQKRLMSRFDVRTEAVRIGRSWRHLNLKQEKANPVVGALTLKAARTRLKKAFARLPELATELEHGTGLGSGSAAGATPGWFLELDHDDLAEETMRPHLPLAGTDRPTGIMEPLAAATPLSELLGPIDLDEICVADDRGFLRNVVRERNLPEFIKKGLPPLYGQRIPLPESARFIENMDRAVRSRFESTIDLGTFLRTSGSLRLADRKRIVEQAILLLESNYVNLPLKRAMHAVDPIQRLRLLEHELDRLQEADMPPEIEFHGEMTEIFNSLRDLHTNYIPPHPFRDKAAFLPFLVEEHRDRGAPVYLVTKVLSRAAPNSFRPGVEVLYWNGTPIDRAVANNADRLGGSNEPARHARGLESLTIRPFLRALPPDEEWVTIRYRTREGKEAEWTQEWLVVEAAGAMRRLDSGSGELTFGLGLDPQVDAVAETKKLLFAPKAMEAENRITRRAVSRASVGEALETRLPTVFRARAVDTSSGRFGHIRVFTFNVPEADEFVEEFARLARHLPERGLMIDVRGNGGGLIHAAERLLQLLTPCRIEPERAQFVSGPINLRLCERHAPSPLYRNLDLGPWVESLAQSVQTGATYSRGFPITAPDSCNRIGQRYHGPVLLITDALCYSATDMFAAGFQDHEIGPVLGVHANTGAGGANVWSHQQLQWLMEARDAPAANEDSPYRQLPQGAGMTVAMRQTLRVGPRAGTPLEDLGVVPDHRHHMTKRDLLHGNPDLLERAAEILKDRQACRLEVIPEVLPTGRLQVRVRNKNITRLDSYINGRPVCSVDAVDPETVFEAAAPSPRTTEEPIHLRVEAYRGDDLVAVSRQRVADRRAVSR